MRNNNSPEKPYIPTIMVVDDNTANLDVLSDALKENEYNVKSAPSGKLALQAAFKEPPDLILLDIMMPEMDGYEVCRKLKENKALENTPVIFVTAMDTEYDEEQGLLIGAVDYITKPIKIPIVLARINTHLQLKFHRDHLENLVRERTINLENSNRELLFEIVARENAEQIIAKSLKEKEVLLKEVHHRVKNNMQFIISMIYLQSQYDKEAETQKAPEEVFSTVINRIQSIASIHELFYHAENLAEINFKEFISTLTSLWLSSYECSNNRIEIDVDSEDVQLDLNVAVPCGLIINELVTNSLKYAFPGDNKGKISISFTCKNDMVEMFVADNGIGLLVDFDILSQESFGLKLVTLLTEQISGKYSCFSDNGTKVVIEFPRTKKHGISGV